MRKMAYLYILYSDRYVMSIINLPQNCGRWGNCGKESLG
jgi:hypothetical protein